MADVIFFLSNFIYVSNMTFQQMMPQYLISLSRGLGWNHQILKTPQILQKPLSPLNPYRKKHAVICLQDSWLHFCGLCPNRTAVQWRSCCLFAFPRFGERRSESRFVIACTFLLLTPPRVIWSLDDILTVRKKHLLSFSVFLVCFSSFWRGASCKLCLMQFSRNGSQFQTEIMAKFFFILQV